MTLLISSNLPAIVGEAARLMLQADATLTTPTGNISISSGDTSTTITLRLPFSRSVDAATGNSKLTYSDFLPALDFTVSSGSPMEAVTTDNTVEFMASALTLLDNAETAKLAADPNSIPAGIGSDYAASAGVDVWTVVLAHTYAIDSAGKEVKTYTNHIA